MDTHALLWMVFGSRRMGKQALRRIQAAADNSEAVVSSFSFWEIDLLHAKGRLQLDSRPCELLRRVRMRGMQVIAVDAAIAIRAVELGYEGFHPDPADRIITATALVAGCDLATSDARIAAWARSTERVGILDASS